MLKLIFKLLILAIAVGIILCVLYIFDLPPFQNTGAPAVQTTTTTPVTDQQKAAVETQSLPVSLQENKVAVNKSYDEMISRAQLLEQNNFPTLAIAQYQEALNKDTSNYAP